MGRPDAANRTRRCCAVWQIFSRSVLTPFSAGDLFRQGCPAIPPLQASHSGSRYRASRFWCACAGRRLRCGICPGQGSRELFLSHRPRQQHGAADSGRGLALVHRQSTLEDGDLGVVVFGEDGEGTLKKFIRRGNAAVILQPFNPEYQPQVLVGEELDQLYIAGKVVETKAKW